MDSGRPVRNGDLEAVLNNILNDLEGLFTAILSRDPEVIAKFVESKFPPSN